MKTHFDAAGTGNYVSGYPECGLMPRIVLGYDNEASNGLQTTDPAEVTCERCKKTAAFKEAVK